MITIVTDELNNNVDQRIFEAIKKKKIEVEYIALTGSDIKPCYHCDGCKYETFRKCIFRDDIDWLYPKIAHADTLIIVSQLIWGTYSYTMKQFLDKFELIADTTNRRNGRELVKGMLTDFTKMYSIGIKKDCSEMEAEIFTNLHKENILLMNLGGKSYVLSDNPENERIENIASEVCDEDSIN